MPQNPIVEPEPPARLIATTRGDEDALGFRELPTLRPADLRRRRAASRRCTPLLDGRRDSLDPEPVREPVSEAQLDCWLDALRHLRCAGLAGTLPTEVLAAVRGRTE